MPVPTSILLLISLILAVTIGPQTRSWSWGPAMLALALSVCTSFPGLWRRGKSPGDFGIVAFCMVVAGWFAFRTWTSPVAELSQADLLLLCATVGAFVSVRAIVGNPPAEGILIWGVAFLLLANVAVAGKQMIEPDFTPIFREKAGVGMITGFFAHYNEAANFFIVSSLFVAGAALFGRHHSSTRVLFLMIAIAGIAAVWFTRSRGGIFGISVGAGALAIVSLIIGKKRGEGWFAPALIAVPLVAAAIGGYLFIGWQNAQALRDNAHTGLEAMFDNNSRLYMLGMAIVLL